jgi:hypothetical protein
MNDEQRGLTAFGAQPERTGPFSRNAALPLACVDWLHGVRGALPCSKMAAVAAIW